MKVNFIGKAILTILCMGLFAMFSVSTACAASLPAKV